MEGFKNFGDPKDMKNRQWVEVLLLKVKHEQYNIELAIDLIYKYCYLDFKENGDNVNG